MAPDVRPVHAPGRLDCERIDIGDRSAVDTYIDARPELTWQQVLFTGVRVRGDRPVRWDLRAQVAQRRLLVLALRSGPCAVLSLTAAEARASSTRDFRARDGPAMLAAMAARDQILERGDELAAIGRLLAEAGEGRGRLLVFEAPAGLGKSALVRRAAALAQRDGLAVLRASGHELERALGWGAARSLFEPWLHALPGSEREELLAGPAAPANALFDPERSDRAGPSSATWFEIMHGLHWLAVRMAERRALALLIDDAHWVDEPSLRFLLYLLGRLEQQPMAIIAAVRTGEAEQGGLLEQLLAHPATTIRELAPLATDAVAEVVRGRLPSAGDALCRRCFELTRGNPLQVRELVSALLHDAERDGGGADLDAAAERAARSLSRSVLRRLRALSPDAQALAQAVAVCEYEVPLFLAASLGSLTPEAALAAADELARHDVLEASDPLAFLHPLLRAAVYGELPRLVRANMHRRAAALLAEHGATVEQVGSHLLEAAPAGDEATVRGLRRAARAAMAHGVPTSAIVYLDRALREPPPAADRPDVLAELGRAEVVAGRRAAVPHLEAAIEITPERRRRAMLQLELGRALHDFGRPAEACAAFERGAEELGDVDDELAVDFEAWYLTSAMLLGERAADAHRRIDAILERAGGGRTRAERALVSKALVMRVYQGAPPAEVVPLARRLFADGRLLDEDGLESQAIVHVAGALSFADDYAAADEVLTRALAHARKRGSVTWIAAAAQLRARQRLWTGPLPAAIEDARAAVDIFAAGAHIYLPAAAYCLARGLLEHDELGAAEEVLALVDAGAPPSGLFLAWRHETAGRLAAYRGEHDVALACFEAMRELTAAVMVTNPALFHWRSQAGLAALRCNRRKLAQQLILEELELARRAGAPRAIGVALRAAALLERGEAAVELLRSAARSLEDCGARMEHALTLVELGAAVRRTGRPAEARASLREAVVLADALDARAVARRASDELVLSGGRRASRHGPDGELTPSERRVAELAAAGRTNREIAAELFVTVKAVEWHLGNVYRKLDVRGRHQLEQAL